MTMKIEINDKNTELLEKICKETSMNPSELMEHFLDNIHPIYSDYERRKNEDIEKRPFSVILSSLLHALKSKLLALDNVKNLIKSTDALLVIKGYFSADIYDIIPDFDKKSVSYSVGYDFCADTDNIYAYKNLFVNVEINQDYIVVSLNAYQPIFENIEITDKEINNTSNQINEYIRARHCEKFSPFATIAVELLPVRENPFNKLEPCFCIGIKLVAKANEASHIPSIEKTSLILREVQAIVAHELLELRS
jgi:hypothetical protein